MPNAFRGGFRPAGKRPVVLLLEMGNRAGHGVWNAMCGVLPYAVRAHNLRTSPHCAFSRLFA